MTISEDHYTSSAGPSESCQSEQSASLPQRCADWISYAVAMIQQAAPTAADFTHAEAGTM